MKYALTILVVALHATCSHGAVTPATWSSWNATSATGDLQGITISATSSSGAPIVGIASNHFGSHWDGMSPLGSSALGLVVSNVNAGDSQTFSFSSPLLDGTIMYIENFDSSSIAGINFIGATSNTLIDASSSIAFANIGPGKGTLISSNSMYDGEGDAAILLSGPVSEITVDYSSGVGANGVFYTFAAPAVPEPTSAVAMAGLFGIGGLIVWRRKKHSSK